MSLSPRERVLRALHGGHADRVPFTMYENKIPQCAVERQLRSRGMCIVKRDVPVFRAHRPNVKTTQQIYWQDDHRFVRTIHETPVGTLAHLDEPVVGTTWHHEKMFKSPDDYKALRFLLRDEQFEPCYDSFALAEARFGGDGIFRATVGLEPLQMLMGGGVMDMQEFCLQWMDHRDEVLKLYDILVDNRRKVYPLIAQSPVTHANYGGIVTPEIIGLEMFEQFFVPHYQEAAQVLHRHGKLLGNHFDANCRLLRGAIAATDLDYIEAFTPAPDTDMSLADARRAWPDKVLWINFPSSVHLRPDEHVIDTTLDLLDQAGAVEGLLFAVTEDVPDDRWQDSCRAIMDGLDRHAQDHPQLYEPTKDPS